jgi:PRTRC genetic system protein B
MSQPIINTTNLSAALQNKSVAAALYFLNSDELLFQWRDGDQTNSKFVSPQDAKSAFQGIGEDTGWLPDGVLRTGSNVRGRWVVYVAPPQIVKIRTDKNERLTIPIPITLFVGWGHRYYLWALSGKVFSNTLPLYNAPFPNVYGNGRICWGSHKVPIVTPMNIKSTWELFFDTVFNNHLSSNRAKSHKNDVMGLLRSLSKKKAKTFPARELVLENRTVEAGLDHLFKYGSD